MKLDKELDCIFANGMLILTPTEQDNSAFAEEILADLIQQDYSGEKLLTEFKKINRKIRPVETLLEEAHIIAQTISSNYSDPTNKLFGIEEPELIENPTVSTIDWKKIT